MDILINNAGIMPEVEDGAFVPVTPGTLSRAYDANVIAPYFLTETLLPLLKASPAGRVVHQSSILGSLTTNASGQTPRGVPAAGV